MLKIILALALCQVLRVDAIYNREKFKSIVLDDHSNDDAIHMNAQQLIKRSGYNYDEHYVVSDDGYITLLIRIVNPRVDRKNLRGPPIMLYHGASIDQSAYVLSSSIQHYPEPWPRSPTDGPMTSSNRSLGFMLANNGYDVWLMGTRGSNRWNQGYTNNVKALRNQPRFQLSEDFLKLVKEDKKKYWSYGLDDIIAYELKEQFDKVLEVTGAQEVSVFSFSLSTPTTMAFLASNPDYARRVRVYFQMAPAIAADHFTAVDKIFFEKLCPLFPTRGIGFLPFYSFTPIARKLILKASRSKRIRYWLIYNFITAFFGPSLKYHTNLELNYLARILQPVSFKSIQHYCLNSLSKQLTKFPYGKKKNLELYGQPKAPVYNISNLEVQKYVVISGTYDGLADPTTVDRLIRTTKTPTAAIHIVCPGFNHVDFQGAVENDIYVNLPVLEILNDDVDKHN